MKYYIHNVLFVFRLFDSDYDKTLMTLLKFCILQKWCWWEALMCGRINYFSKTKKEPSIFLAFHIKKLLNIFENECPRIRLPDSMNSECGKGEAAPFSCNRRHSFKSLECWSPLILKTCQDMPFWDAVKWFRLRILHSILLKLFSVGRRPLDYFHVVGVQANLSGSP